MSRILLVDDDRAFRVSTAALLREEGHEVVPTEDGQQAVEALALAPFDLLILDMRMPGIDGIDLVEVLRTRGEGTPILMISGFGTVDSAVRALHTGADDFLTKPVEPDVLLGRVDALLTARPTPDEAAAYEGMIGRSPGVLRVFEDIRKVADSETTVLITGETGTGKELVARAVHRGSPRRDGPFVGFNCAALTESLAESELFGHLKGAFTGAMRDKPGLFRAAHGGTLFLDEIGDVSPAIQQRLLRAIEEREFLPVGGVQPERVDVRIVAATNRPLREHVAAGSFREDLYYRLDVFRITVPPLRERRGDVPLLVEHFLQRRGGRPLPVSPLALRLLSTYPWPGNVRQLFAVLESAAVRAGEGPIQAQHLPAEVRERGAPTAAGLGAERYRAEGSPDEERTTILAALREAEGVRSRAAAMLGMGRTTLWRKMRELGIDGSDGEDG